MQDQNEPRVDHYYFQSQIEAEPPQDQEEQSEVEKSEQE